MRHVPSFRVMVCLYVVVEIYFWFKIFETSLILFPFVSDYDKENDTMQILCKTSLKNFKPKTIILFKPQHIHHPVVRLLQDRYCKV